MAKKTTKAIKNAKSFPGSSETDAVSEALHGLGSAVGTLCRAVDHSEELGSLRHLEDISSDLGRLANALDAVSHAIAASVIAQHGNAEDRGKVVEHLKTWFWESSVFKER